MFIWEYSMYFIDIIFILHNKTEKNNSLTWQVRDQELREIKQLV